MDIITLLFRMGCRTYVQDIVTKLPTDAASTPFEVGKIMPTDVGFIFGLSTYADGVDANGSTLITTTQAQNMWLTLQDGATQFVQQIRLDDLLNTFSGSPVIREDKFTKINLPTFDLSKSFYNNPNSYFGADVSIHLKMWYVEANDWKRILPILSKFM